MTSNRSGCKFNSFEVQDMAASINLALKAMLANGFKLNSFQLHDLDASTSLALPSMLANELESTHPNYKAWMLASSINVGNQSLETQTGHPSPMARHDFQFQCLQVHMRQMASNTGTNVIRMPPHPRSSGSPCGKQHRRVRADRSDPARKSRSQ